ncbi:Enhancer of polycomb-like protein 1 [Tieghemiomyces parasiticus]|uniref:Enhancer of polycomb-like protein n=1 Tax=Tieghemiomyces parasiticus TaxID=78921 RepID=A0A9W8E0K8_9FUNG|nr:Enhancer of polycomb-like protein 1 [Tieghemiomyces parasiticus]
MSKAKFRSRKIDFKRPLPVYRASELPDLEDATALQRTAPLVETGVEKEEEEEHHLQAVISAAQAAASGGGSSGGAPVAPLYIPTPDASRSVADYDKIYRKTFVRPSSYIRFSATVEESVGCPYCMDEDDTAWLVSFNKGRKASQKLPEDVFETIMWQYETLTRDMVFTSDDDLPTFATLEARAHEKVTPLHSQARLLYDYWHEKRVDRNLRPLMPTLKFDEVGRLPGTTTTAANDADPYVCFRRREVKPLRKTRRTDAHSMEKLKRLQAELETARGILEMVSRREKMRKESLVLEQIVFQQKCTVLQQRRALNVPRDENDDLFGSRRRTRKQLGAHDSGANRTTITIPLRRFKDHREGSPLTVHSPASTAGGNGASTPLLKVPFLVPPKLVPSMSELAHKEVSRRRALNEGWVDTTANPYEPAVSKPPHPLGFYRAYPDAARYPTTGPAAYHRPHPYRRPAPATGSADKDVWNASSPSGLYTRPHQPSFRCRMGRNGRLFVDRRYLPVSPADSDGSTVSAEDLSHPATRHARYGYDYDAYRYDDGGSADFNDLVMLAPASRAAQRYRLGLLTEPDQRSLITKPSFIHLSNHQPATPSAAQSTASTSSTTATTAAASVSGFPSTSKASTGAGATATAISTTTKATAATSRASASTPAARAAPTKTAMANSNKIQLSSETLRSMFGSSPLNSGSPLTGLIPSPVSMLPSGTHSPFVNSLTKQA